MKKPLLAIDIIHATRPTVSFLRRTPDGPKSRMYRPGTASMRRLVLTMAWNAFLG